MFCVRPFSKVTNRRRLVRCILGRHSRHQSSTEASVCCMNTNSFSRWPFQILAIAWITGAMQACVPQPRYRASLPSTSPPASSSKVSPDAPPLPVPEPPRTPLPQEAKIREQDLKARSPITPPAAKETPKPPVVPPEATTGPLPDDSSLLAKITPGTSPQRAASLRLTEEGRKLLEAGDAPKALSRLEKTIVIDSTNAYGYFYLAKTHYRLGRYKESLSFLDVAESRLSAE